MITDRFVGTITCLQASLSLYDVPSLEHEGKTLGSIVFAESFVVSAIKTAQPGTCDLS